MNCQNADAPPLSQLVLIDFAARTFNFQAARQPTNLVIPAKAHFCPECFGVVPCSLGRASLSQE